MHEVCWHCSCPTGKHLWCESCQGQMVFGTWLMSLCSWGLPVLPSAALLQRCYYRGHSIDPPCGCCEGRWPVRQCIRVTNLESCALCQASLEAYCVVWLSALCSGQSCILAPLKCARLSAREACSRDSAWEYCAKIYWGPDHAQSF